MWSSGRRRWSGTRPRFSWALIEMATSTGNSLVKRKVAELALMPPPPVKRIRRPTTVLDEDDYTAALSEIIKRDYFPGLLESEAQREYLAALESNNSMWIEEAGKKLIQASKSGPGRRKGRNTWLETPSATPRPRPDVTPATSTIRGWTGQDTPGMTPSVAGTEDEDTRKAVDTTDLSLSAFQAKYTSEDNESFNALLDRQNQKRREKHAYHWTKDRRLPSARQIAQKADQPKLLTSDTQPSPSEQALIPIQTGAVANRPSQPETWTTARPDNTFMFGPPSIDEVGLPTIAESKEAASKAGPKSVVYNNTRFPSSSLTAQDSFTTPSIPPSPSLNTSIIARRDLRRAARPSNAPSTAISEAGGETPRVNGYAFVDEDEPDPNPPNTITQADEGPSYRDLLAGQVGDATPNPFRIGDVRRREEVHWKLVERTARLKRDKDRGKVAGGISIDAGSDQGNMTPAARRLMERIGQTPVRQAENGGGERNGEGDVDTHAHAEGWCCEEEGLTGTFDTKNTLLAV